MIVLLILFGFRNVLLNAYKKCLTINYLNFCLFGYVALYDTV